MLNVIGKDSNNDVQVQDRDRDRDGGKAKVGLVSVIDHAVLYLSIVTQDS